MTDEDTGRADSFVFDTFYSPWFFEFSGKQKLYCAYSLFLLLPSRSLYMDGVGRHVYADEKQCGREEKRYDRKNGICKISSFILQNKKMRSRNDDYDAYCCNWQSYINNYAFQYGGINARNSIFYRRISYVGRCIYHNDSN